MFNQPSLPSLVLVRFHLEVWTWSPLEDWIAVRCFPSFSPQKQTWRRVWWIINRCLHYWRIFLCACLQCIYLPKRRSQFQDNEQRWYATYFVRCDDYSSSSERVGALMDSAINSGRFPRSWIVSGFICTLCEVLLLLWYAWYAEWRNIPCSMTALIIVLIIHGGIFSPPSASISYQIWKKKQTNMWRGTASNLISRQR